MVVIVIVGVLSAVALPNFLSQTARAKGTEAKSQISAVIKNAAAEYQQLGTAGIDVTGGTCTLLGAPEPKVQKFDYTCGLAGQILTVTATANDTDDSIESNAVVMTVDFSNGQIALDRAKTNKMFGGTLADSKPTG